MDANVLIQVFLSTSVNPQGVGRFSAFVDPDISIDPTFANAGEYSLAFSAGIPTASTTPIPSAFLMFGSVVALGGFGLRKIRRASQT
jgi:hypothetical protein